MKIVLQSINKFDQFIVLCFPVVVLPPLPMKIYFSW